MKRFCYDFSDAWRFLPAACYSGGAATRHWTLRQKRRRRSQSPSCPTRAPADDWAVISVVRGGFDAPENWTDSYYRALAGKVLSTGGVLSKTRLTEYARVILGLTAIGEDPANVAGYHLLAALSDYDAATQPGVTSAAYVLLALDCGNYEIPKTEAGKTQATREMYVDFMLGKQLSDGGWAIGAEEADPDVTAMVLQALAPYQSTRRSRTQSRSACSGCPNCRTTTAATPPGATPAPSPARRLF